MKNEQEKTKVVVIGGSGLIGSKVVSKLAEHGYEAIAASPDTGVNSITGEGLAEAMEGASVVVDVSNSPSFEEGPATEFFTKSTSNLLKAEAAAGVKHHVALSVVGTEELAGKEGIGGYFRAKLAQENLIRSSVIPFSIVHATQFFEFAKSIADASTVDGEVRLPSAKIQPMAADEVARFVGKTAAGAPLNGTLEVSGPEIFGLDEFIRKVLAVRNDSRPVITDENAGYFGASISERTLIPKGEAQVASTSIDAWLAFPQNVNPPQMASNASAGTSSSR